MLESLKWGILSVIDARQAASGLVYKWYTAPLDVVDHQ